MVVCYVGCWLLRVYPYVRMFTLTKYLWLRSVYPGEILLKVAFKSNFPV